MMDLSTIRGLSREAAERAADAGNVPLVLEAHDIEDGAVRGIPNLGDYLPDGWNRVDLEGWFGDDRPRGVFYGDNEGHGAFFVDSSGWGGPGEPAIGLDDLVNLLRPGFGYALVEEGQFQVKVGVFERT